MDSYTASIPSYELVTEKDHKGKQVKPYIVYNLVIGDSSEEFRVQYRYSKFDLLHKELVEQFKDVPNCEFLNLFPKKRFLGNKSEKFVATRRQALQAYVQAVLSHPQAQASKAVRNFLTLPERSVRLVARASKDPEGKELPVVYLTAFEVEERDWNNSYVYPDFLAFRDALRTGFGTLSNMEFLDDLSPQEDKTGEDVLAFLCSVMDHPILWRVRTVQEFIQPATQDAPEVALARGANLPTPKRVVNESGLTAEEEAFLKEDDRLAFGDDEGITKTVKHRSEMKDLEALFDQFDDFEEMGKAVEEGGGAPPEDATETDLNAEMSNLMSEMASAGFGVDTHVCAFCRHDVAVGVAVHSLGKWWHPEHLVCSRCSIPSTEAQEVFKQHEGAPFCKACYVGFKAPKCGKCNKVIEDDIMIVREGVLHPECFACVECGAPVESNDYRLEGKPACARHFFGAQGLLCVACSGPIIEQCVSVGGHRFHKSCFVCALCKSSISGTVKMHDDQPYCPACHTKLF